MDADDDDHNSDQEENNDMPLEEESRPRGPGGAGGADDSDAMIGLLTSLNIVDITEVFSPPQSRDTGREARAQSRVEHGPDDGMEL